MAITQAMTVDLQIAGDSSSTTYTVDLLSVVPYLYTTNGFSSNPVIPVPKSIVSATGSYNQGGGELVSSVSISGTVATVTFSSAPTSIVATLTLTVHY